MVNFGRESEASPASVCQEVVEVELKPNVVLPQTSQGVRNSRNTLK